MDLNRLQYLHQKYIGNQMSPDELEEWKALLAAPTDTDQPIHQLMDEHWLLLKAETGYRIGKQRSEKMYNEIIGHRRHDRTWWTFWPRIAVAAAIITVAFASGILYYNRQYKITEQGENYANDIAPGRNGATLTLADGRKIRINDVHSGNIAEQSGVRISKDENGQVSYEIINNNNGKIAYNTLSTTRGEQTRVRLPDGSLVFLNAASSLRYPTSFTRLMQRKVELNGEGYFEVAKDREHPFIVRSGAQEVEVLGTHFNINSYNDETIKKTTLLEGSVKVQADMQQAVTLSPGQQAALSPEGKILIEAVDTETVVAWKNNRFMFDGEDIQTVMRMVARWYNVEVEYVGDISTEKFMGGVSRFDNVSKVLRSLESTGKVRFKIEGKKIYITK